MLHHSEELFLTSQEMYKLPSEAAYTKAKNDALLFRDPQYGKKNVSQKWEFLIDQFSNSLPTLPASDRPDELTTKQIQERLTDFKKKRNQTFVSSSNLSLEQCNRYFEDFLFLWTTEDPCYKLTHNSKKTLLASIVRAMDVCETGINTEFYAVLQEVQRDSDWVRSELSKARAECIRDLHKRYNTENNIQNIMNVHVYDYFVKMANKHHLGIQQKETILDIYGWLLGSQSLDDFFNNNYKQIFQKYEHDAPITLTTYIVSEINSVLGPDRWQNNPKLNTVEINTLMQFLNMHFKNADPDQILDEENPDGPIANCSFKLKPKEEFYNAVKNLILQKMITDDYYINIKKLIKTPTLRRNVTRPNDLSWDILLQTYHVIQENQFTLIRDNAQHLKIIQDYPELILSQIRKHPELVLFLPHTQLDINKSVLAIFADLLQQEVDTPHHPSRTQVHMSHLIDFFDGDPESLQQLPVKLLNHREIGKAMVAKDGLLWTILSENLKEDEDIYNIAHKQNPGLIYYTLEPKARVDRINQLINDLPSEVRPPTPDNLDASVRQRILRLEDLDASVRRILRLEAYFILSTQDNLPVAEFLKYAPKIRADMLSKAIIYRKKNGLKPLPIIGQSSQTLAILAEFNGKIDANVFNQNRFKIRKQAESETINQADHHHPWVYLARSKDWIHGFRQYQAYKLGEGRRTVNFKALLFALATAIFCVLATFLFLKALMFILPIVLPIASLFRAKYSLPLCASARVILDISKMLRSRALSRIGLILISLAFLDWVLFGTYILMMVGLLYVVFAELKIVSDYVIQGVGALMQSRAHEPSTHQNGLEQIESVIARLALLDDSASHQKVDILKQLKTQMNGESNAFPHSALINKRYTVIYQQKTYQISFAEVAACRRSIDGQFSLEKSFGNAITFGLFHVPTSSERILSKLMQEARNEVVPVTI